jgi:hypothetical protein
MIYLCIVIEVTQKRSPQRTIVMIPGTQPRTLKTILLSASLNRYLNEMGTHERDHDCAMMAKQTCSPASKQAVFCHDIVRSLISCSWSGRKQCQLTPTYNAQPVPAATRAVMVSNESVPSVSVPRT